MGTCAPIPVTEGSELSPECIPSEAIGAVPGRCGVFVASFGTDDNDGSKLSPVATLSRAIEIRHTRSRWPQLVTRHHGWKRHMGYYVHSPH